MEEMKGLGKREAQLSTAHSPIDLAIKSRTPHEIAISIAAQLIEVANIALPEVFTLKIINFVLIYFVWGSEVGSIAPIEVEILFVQFRISGIEITKRLERKAGPKLM